MKNFTKKLLSILMVVMMLVNLMPTTALAAHTHKGAMCGKQVTTYEKKDSSSHKVITQNEELCSCGQFLGYIDRRETTAAHEFSNYKCTKCGYEKKHTHVDVMCGKSKSWYENITSTKHTYVTANEGLCACGEFVKYVDVKKTTANHTFKNDKCTKCGYKRTHVHQGAACGKAVSWYENITATTHTLYTANENLCSCGTKIGYIDEKRTQQNHSFNGDVCSACGYKREHVHKGVACGQAIRRYVDINSKTHTLYTANENLCSCGAMIGYIDENRVAQNHNFNGDVCSDCGYKREHVHKGVACGSSVWWYEDVNANTHTLYTANENLCSCGAMIGYIDENRVVENHNFLSGDICSGCSYKREHVHQGVMCGKAVSWYQNITETTHTLYTANENLCSCGEMIGYIDEKLTKNEHDFSNDECTKCGYKREHVHQGIACGQAIRRYEDINSKTHTLYTANENLCSCGAMIGYIDENRVAQNHNFSGDICSDCGYQREHVHQGVACGKSVSWYQNITETTHTLYTANENLCSCGEKVGYIDEKLTKSEHAFSNDKCTKCGYEREHVHQGVACGQAIRRYEDINSKTHTLYTANENICSCGEMIGYIDENRVAQNHNFSGDICSDCGYQREHVHKGVACGKAVSWYQNITEMTHTLYTANEELCSCGEKLGYIDEKLTKSEHAFSDDKCTKCGYEREHVHQGVASGKAISRYEDINGSTHTLYIANENICSCGEMIGYIDENRVTKNHNFNGDVCSDCGYKRNHQHKGVACGQAIVRYEDLNANTHTLYTANEEICSCGEMIGYVDVNRVVRPHMFVRDKCTDCGYERSHVHQAVKSGPPRTYYEKVDHNYHKCINVSESHICSCDYVVSEGKKVTSIEEHLFVEGFCIFCKEPEHIHSAVASANKGTRYAYADEEQHVKITVTGGHFCSCGEFMPTEDGNIIYTYENHKFTDKKCTKCGYNSKGYIEVAVDQIIFGDFSDDVNIAGTGGQILVGELPIIGFVADVRDLLGSKSLTDLLINAVAFLPFGGFFKYSDEVGVTVKNADKIKYTDEIAGAGNKVDDFIEHAAKINLRDGEKAAESFRDIARASDSTSDAYKNFDAFKKAHGPAGEGMEWHHIVEQSQINKSGFDSSMINNGNNMIPIDEATHRKISGYYSRKVPGTDMSFRDWLAYNDVPFEQQQEIGIKILELYGIKVK